MTETSNEVTIYYRVPYYGDKDRMTTLKQSFIVYKFACPGSSAHYVGKTERALLKRIFEHPWGYKDVLSTSTLMNEMMFSICSILSN